MGNSACLAQTDCSVEAEESRLENYFRHGYLEGVKYRSPRVEYALDEVLHVEVLRLHPEGPCVLSEALVFGLGPNDPASVLWCYLDRLGFCKVLTRTRSELALLQGSTRLRFDPPDAASRARGADSELQEEFCIPVLLPEALACDELTLESLVAAVDAKEDDARQAAREVLAFGLPQQGLARVWVAGSCCSVEVGRCRLARSERLLGFQHCDTLRALDDMAALRVARGEREEATLLLKQAVESRESASLRGDLTELTALHGLARTLRALGEVDDAAAAYRQAVAAMPLPLAPSNEHEHVAQVVLACADELAALLLEGGGPPSTEAEGLLRGALASWPPSHPESIACLCKLAQMLKETSRPGEARGALRAGLEAAAAELGAQHPRTLPAVNALAALILGAGEANAAEALLRPALLRGVEALGLRHPETLAAAETLAQALRALGRLLDAQEVEEAQHAGSTVVVAHRERHPTVASDDSGCAQAVAAVTAASANQSPIRPQGRACSSRRPPSRVSRNHSMLAIADVPASTLASGWLQLQGDWPAPPEPPRPVGSGRTAAWLDSPRHREASGRAAAGRGSPRHGEASARQEEGRGPQADEEESCQRHDPTDEATPLGLLEGSAGGEPATEDLPAPPGRDGTSPSGPPQQEAPEDDGHDSSARAKALEPSSPRSSNMPTETRTFELSQSMGLRFGDDATVQAVDAGSRAEGLGVRVGWKVLSVDGHLVHRFEDLDRKMQSLRESRQSGHVLVVFAAEFDKYLHGAGSLNEAIDTECDTFVAWNTRRLGQKEHHELLQWANRVCSSSNTSGARPAQKPAAQEQARPAPMDFEVSVDLTKPLGVLFCQTLAAKAVKEGSQAAQLGVREGWRATQVRGEPVRSLSELNGKLQALKDRGILQVNIGFALIH